MSERTQPKKRFLRALGVLGALGIVGGAAAALAGLAMPVPLMIIGGGLVALGLNGLIAGDWLVGPPPRPFTARGEVVRGVVEIHAGWSDAVVSDGPIDRIASVVYGPFGKPDFTFEEGIAYLRLRRTLPLSRWQADLAGNVLWDVRARSTVGDLTLDLTRLRIEEVRARCGAGRLAVRCPSRGFVRLVLHTTLGQIEVIVPPEVGVRLRVKATRLAAVRVSAPGLYPAGDGSYATEGYEAAAAAVDVMVSTSAGEIAVRGESTNPAVS